MYTVAYFFRFEQPFDTDIQKKHELDISIKVVKASVFDAKTGFFRLWEEESICAGA